MKNSLSRNYIYNVIYQIVAIIAPTITAPYIARVLLADGVGAFQYVSSVVSIFSIVIAFGTSSYAMREIAYLQDKKYDRSKLFFEVLIIRAIAVLVSLVPYYLFFCRGDLAVLYQIMSIQILAVALETNWFFQGIEDFKSITIRNTIVRIISVILIFLFVKRKEDLYIYTLIIASTTLAGCCVQLLCIKKHIVKCRLNYKDIRKHIYPSLALFIPTIAINVYTSLDKTVLGMLSSKAEVGYYSQVETIIKMSMLVITSLGTVLMPRIANMLVSCSKNEVVNQINKSCVFVLFLGYPMMIGMIMIAPIFIPLFLGPGYDQCILLMRFMPVIVLIIGLASVTGASIMIPLKRQKQYTISVVVGALSNLILNCVLIPHFGSVGATIATIVAESLVLILELYYIRDYVKIHTVLLNGKNYAICSLIMGVILYYLNFYFCSTLIFNILFILIGVVVYILSLLILKDKFFLESLSAIRKKIGAIRNVG